MRGRLWQLLVLRFDLTSAPPPFLPHPACTVDKNGVEETAVGAKERLDEVCQHFFISTSEASARRLPLFLKGGPLSEQHGVTTNPFKIQAVKESKSCMEKVKYFLDYEYDC